MGKYDTEEVEIARIIKKNGSIMIDTTADCSIFELYGFLKVYMSLLNERLMLAMTEDEDNDEDDTN